MAICDEVPQIRVTVRVNGSEAAEYNDEDGSPENDPSIKVMNTVSKYIESQDDATFSICITIDSSYSFQPDDHSLSCAVLVDGKWIRTPIMTTRRLAVEVNGHDWLPEGSSTWKTQPLKFAGITTVENTAESRVKEDSIAAKSLGLIQVCVQRCVTTGKSAAPQQKNTASTTELAEKALKGSAASHGAVYGADVDIPTPNFVKCTDLDEGTGLIRFNFKYRSRDSLQKLMIIPRTPSPDPVEEEIGNLSQEAIVSLARRQLLHERATSNDTIKAEDMTVIKKEAEVYDLTGEAPVCVRKRKRAKTIDLTED
ncbi:hypothetical protein B0T11DRAFT_274902 [Plectosphaerella cucumerina]|uniref:DUF7918 domain-containing protein n=1 Tax=Plectosphaerella cucumerina TaxID=40658 RepID=A0A8K0TPM9_9PEZI|nr:hypothetical protein B0T11DRAFT_274902 [Plectosphaerella cucumerina]